MSKVLFIIIPTHGHVNPTLGLVEELIKRGEQVTYLSTEEFKEKIEGTGAKFKKYDTKGKLDLSAFNLDKLDSTVLKNFLKSFREITEFILNDKEKYDYLFCDRSFTIGGQVAERLNLPIVYSITTFAVNNDLRKQMLFFENAQEELVKDGELQQLLKSFREGHGTSSGKLTANNRGMINMVYTSRYFQPLQEEFDESYKFIGPCIVDRVETVSFDFSRLRNRKIVYISLGTIFNDAIQFYEDCFEAFKGMDIQFVLSVGKKIDISQLNEIPENFIVSNYVPQLEILKRADVFITHGGMNSTNEGLYFGVPVIVIPAAADQPMVAKRVAELGAGIHMDKDEITPELLRKALAEILSEKSYRENSEKIGESLRSAGGFKKGADEIFKFKAAMQINQ